MRGVVTKFDQDRGFGFIKLDGYQKAIFVHVRNINDHTNLRPGQNVSCEITRNNKGLEAINVYLISQSYSPYIIFSLLAVFLISLFIILAIFLTSVSWMWAYLFGVNASTLILYAYDKIIAGSSRTRVPEICLHSLAIAGGTPAAFIAQKFYQHKTRKQSFQMYYWAIVGIQILLIVVASFLTNH